MTHKNRYPTSIDVARHAGVSQSAVSRTFTHEASISPRMRERVLAAARDLGYRPNAIPSIMKGKRSRMIAVVIGGMENPFYTQVLDELAIVLRARDQQILLARVESNHALDEVIDQLTRYRVDAVFSALAVTSEETGRALSEFRIPVVSFNTPFNAPWVSSVNSDNELAGRQAARLLHGKGVSRLGFIHGPYTSPAEMERFHGFSKQLDELGGTTLHESRGNYDYGGGHEAVRELWRFNEPPQALFCANDLMALGAMDALRHEFGKSIPHDVRVIGYDNLSMCSWQGYQLTSFDQNVDLMVNHAVELLLSEDLGIQGTAVRVAPSLVERASSG